jgi:hypothetical protein
VGNRKKERKETKGKEKKLPFKHTTHTRKHRASTSQHNIAIEMTSEVSVALHDRVVNHLVDARGLAAQEGRLEQRLWTAESLCKSE